jgi:hypothetical protein
LGKFFSAAMTFASWRQIKVGFYAVGTIHVRSDMLLFARYSHLIRYFMRNGYQ